MADLALSSALSTSITRSAIPVAASRVGDEERLTSNRALAQAEGQSRANQRIADVEADTQSFVENSARKTVVEKVEAEEAATNRFRPGNLASIPDDMIRERPIRSEDELNALGRTVPELTGNERANIAVTEAQQRNEIEQRQALQEAVELIQQRQIERSNTLEDELIEDNAQEEIRTENTLARAQIRQEGLEDQQGITRDNSQDDPDVIETLNARQRAAEGEAELAEDLVQAELVRQIALERYNESQKLLEEARAQDPRIDGTSEQRIELLRERIAEDDVRVPRSIPGSAASEADPAIGLNAELQQGEQPTNQETIQADSSAVVDGALDGSRFRPSGLFIDRFV
ncbi:MAG: hypothetical protein AB8B77_01835 [Alphaproteobacteria bacterium]